MILLDTNVVSEIMRANADAAVDRWYIANVATCWLPSIALAEIAFGVALLPVGSKRTKLTTQLTDLRLAFAARTHAFTGTTALIYGDVMAGARLAGHQMTVPDAQIAAIAREHNLALATRNVRDFKFTSVALIDPWNI